jgi:hypothetical protein
VLNFVERTHGTSQLRLSMCSQASSSTSRKRAAAFVTQVPDPEFDDGSVSAIPSKQRRGLLPSGAFAWPALHGL